MVSGQRVTECVICGNSILKVFAQLAEGRLLKCDNCNTILKDPPVGDVDAEGQGRSLPMDNLVHCYESMYRDFRDQTSRRILEGVVANHGQIRRCLDVGCATGWFLEMATLNGFECYGVDISKVAISKARQAVPAGQFEVGSLSNETFVGTTFELITLLDVLEHIADPMNSLQVISRKLAPDGWLVIRVPIIDSLIFWSSQLAYHATRSKYRMPLNRLFRYHVIGFSITSLYSSLSRCGFQVFRSWRENSIDPRWISQKDWGQSIIMRGLVRLLLFLQRVIGFEDEIVIFARRLNASTED